MGLQPQAQSAMHSMMSVEGLSAFLTTTGYSRFFGMIIAVVRSTLPQYSSSPFASESLSGDIPSSTLEDGL